MKKLTREVKAMVTTINEQRGQLEELQSVIRDKEVVIARLRRMLANFTEDQDKGETMNFETRHDEETQGLQALIDNYKRCPSETLRKLPANTPLEFYAVRRTIDAQTLKDANLWKERCLEAATECSNLRTENRQLARRAYIAIGVSWAAVAVGAGALWVAFVWG